METKRKKVKILVSNPTGAGCLHYTGDIIEEDSQFITFLDREGLVLKYNKNLILRMEEVGARG